MTTTKDELVAALECEAAQRTTDSSKTPAQAQPWWPDVIAAWFDGEDRQR